MGLSGALRHYLATTATLRSPHSIAQCRERVAASLEPEDYWEFLRGKGPVHGELLEDGFRVSKVLYRYGGVRRRYTFGVHALRAVFSPDEGGCLISCSNLRIFFARLLLLLHLIIVAGSLLVYVRAAMSAGSPDHSVSSELWALEWLVFVVIVVSYTQCVLNPIAMARGEWRFLLHWLSEACDCEEISDEADRLRSEFSDEPKPV